MTMRHYRHILAACVVVLMTMLLSAREAPGATNLAVFNFQLKTGQEDWIWLEKFMSDQMATDLVQDRSLSVIARDRMQLIAQKMKWTPEFATGNAKAMGRIRSQLRIEYLVTGVCRVQDENLEITAQIVEVGSRKEVFRKTVSGKTDQVIDLQKQLSADVMSWLTRKPAGSILKALPIWTRSIPAVRALYEGMHLYDQGRYAEGWLKFRQSSQKDTKYIEAVYWVGKMYYFMYRYDHARRTLEQFVYLDCLHPRMGDAIVEYANTFEEDSASTQDLLALFDSFGRRFGHASVISGYKIGLSSMSGSQWAHKKTIGLMAAQGQHRQIAAMEAPLCTNDDAGAKHLGIVSLLNAHATTGAVVSDDILVPKNTPRLVGQVLRFSKPRSQQEYVFSKGKVLYGYQSASKDKVAQFYPGACEQSLYLLAGSQSIFTSLRFTVDSTGNDALVTVSLKSIGSKTTIASQTVSIGQARKEGIVFSPAPRTGMLVAKVAFKASNDESGRVTVASMTVEAALEEVSTCGSLKLQCVNTNCFRVEVDGAFARFGRGLVGPLSPGRHTLTLRPIAPYSQYGDWSTTVDVRADEVQQLRATLPWKDPGVSASITTACLGLDYARPCAFTTRPLQAPAIQLDQQAIRLVWSRHGDLWSCASTDGNTFTAPRKLPLPISSAWSEEEPRLVRDESGRFILTFLSNRDSQHRSLLYSCWSFDCVNWGAPTCVVDKSCRDYDLCLDSSGRLICALIFSEGHADSFITHSQPDGKKFCMEHVAGDPGRLTLYASTDCYQWEPLTDASSDLMIPYDKQSRLLARDDGRIDVYYISEVEEDPNGLWSRPMNMRGGQGRIVSMNTRRRGQGLASYAKLKRYSYDGHKWSAGVSMAHYHHDLVPHYLSAARSGQGAVVLSSAGSAGASGDGLAIIHDQGGKVSCSGSSRGLINGAASIGHHPRWGFVVANGSYVMRSNALPAMLTMCAKATPAPAVTKQAMLPYTRFVSYGAQGELKSTHVWHLDNRGRVEPSAPGVTPKATLGQLHWINTPGLHNSFAFRMEGKANFKPAKAGSGTVRPDARVVTFRNDGHPISVAIDSAHPDAVHYDVLRVDVTGKGNFIGAPIVPWYYRYYAPRYNEDKDQWKRSVYGPKRNAPVSEPQSSLKLPMLMETHCEARTVMLKSAGGEVPAYASGIYTEGKVPALTFSLIAAAEGLCMFGDEQLKVYVCDDNNTLRLGDSLPGAGGGGHDRIIIVLKDGSSVSSSLSKPVPLNGKLYVVKVSSGTMKISSKPYTGQVCTIRINHVAWKARIDGRGFSYNIVGGPEPLQLPPGYYLLATYSEYSSANPNAQRYTLVINRGGIRMELAPGGNVTIPIGSPLVGTLDITVVDRTVKLHYTEKTGVRLPADICLPGDKYGPDYERHVSISDENGRPVVRINMDWDWGKHDWVAQWQPRTELKGTFTATIECDSGPFIAKPATATFTVK